MMTDNCTILILSPDAELVDTVHSYSIDLKYDIVNTGNINKAVEAINNNFIETALIDTRTSDYQSLIDSLNRSKRHINTIFIFEDSDFSKIFEIYKDIADDFIRHPVAEIDLSLSFNRLSNIEKSKIKSTKNETYSKMNEQEESSQFVYDEKLHVIKQIVNNMSEYIREIADHVHGGIKYINELPYCISIHSTNLKVLYSNQTFKKNFGDKTDACSWEIYDGHHGTNTTCPVALTVKSEKTMTDKYVVNYKSGLKVPVFVHTAPVVKNSGDVEFIIEVFAGIRELDAIARSFQTLQQDYHQLFDSVPSYIAVLNRNKEITEVNRSFKEDFGDQTGRYIFDVLKPGSLPTGDDPISKVFQDLESHQAEIVLTSKDGRQYNMMTWAAPITTPSGKLTQVLTVLADKTETRNLKDNLSSLGLMLGTLSHNLKGSLTGLDAGLYLIDTGFYRDKPARIEEGLDVSKLMVDRIRKMIFNVLYYAKERDLNFTETNVRQFAGDVAAHVENRILGGNISFICEFPENEILFTLDPDLLRSALINILENAREICISDTTDKQYEIKFKVFLENNNLVFDIYDNGSGMDEEQQKQLFSIFSSSKGLKGTGLGLYITNEVIRKHSGTITVTSEPGVGTCFSIRIPNTLHSKKIKKLT